jgi:hypothetical protein
MEVLQDIRVGRSCEPRKHPQRRDLLACELILAEKKGIRSNLLTACLAQVVRRFSLLNDLHFVVIEMMKAAALRGGIILPGFCRPQIDTSTKEPSRILMRLL